MSIDESQLTAAIAHVDGDLLPPGHDPPDHAQLPQRASEFGVVHMGDGRRYLGLVNGHCRLS